MQVVLTLGKHIKTTRGYDAPSSKYNFQSFKAIYNDESRVNLFIFLGYQSTTKTMRQSIGYVACFKCFKWLLPSKR